MNLNFNVTGKVRKALVNAIAEILGEEAKYQGTPSYAYIIGKYTVDKNGTLEGRKNANLEAKLAEQGFAADELAEEESPAEIADEIALTPENQADDGDSTESPETDETGADNGEDSESPYGETHLSVDTENTLTISFPRASLTLNAVENLHKMVASKAPLLRKALGTELLPISDDGEELRFAWFKMGIPHEELMAYSQFITQLCKTAQEKQRVTATAPESFENEKFSMRVWLISLGMKGAEFATIRKLMMAKLDGNSGFRYEDKQPRNPRSGGTLEPKQVVSVRFTEDMLGKLAELASQSGMSRNALIESVVAEYVQAEMGAVETVFAPESEGEE